MERLLGAIVAVVSFACSANGQDHRGAVPPSAIRYTLDPYGETPLSAVVRVDGSVLHLDEVTRMEVTVHGQGEDAANLTTELDPRSEAFHTSFDMGDLLTAGEVGIPVLGLYPSSRNLVTFRLSDGSDWAEGKVVIETGAVSDTDATVHVADVTRMEPGLTYLNGRVYDRHGNVRWAGPRVLHIARNGNILTDLREVTWLGKTVHEWRLPEHLAFHHDMVALPNGNVVACVDNSDTTIIAADGTVAESVGDYIVELDDDSSVVNAWDLRDFLDVDRATVANRIGDWLHVNTVAYDETDDSILVSARYQGIVKLTRGGTQGEAPNAGKELVWVFGPQMGWGLAGEDGSGPLDPGLWLLTAVDSDGNAYDAAIQENLSAPDALDDDFQWPIGQHGLVITSRSAGRLSFLTFNNQASFIFDGEGTTANGVTWDKQGDLTNDRSPQPYSAIVEYEVDEASRTVRQLWSFGEEQPELYGSYESGVSLLPVTGNRLMLSNGVDQHAPGGSQANPHVVEVTEGGEVVFHLEVMNTGLSAYRGGRIDLYHPAKTE